MILLKKLKNKQGMALLITITIVTLLVAATLEMNRKTRDSVIITATIRDRLTLSHIASSGINIAMAMLIKDKMSDPPDGLDSGQEDWANPEKISELLQEVPLEQGRVTFKITDELGKIQVNSLVKFPEGKGYNEMQYQMWDNLLRPVVSEDEDADINATTNIISCVIDWLDSGDDDAITGLNGAESDYYKSLDPPYECKNGPITHLNELFMIKGIKPEYFQGIGGFSEDSEGIESISDLSDENKKKMPDLSKFMTVYGMKKAEKKIDKKDFAFEGKININTADLPVLIAIVGPDNVEYAQAIYDYRQEKEEDHFVNTDLTNKTWYRNAEGVPNDFTIKEELICYASDIFQIEAIATLHDMKESVITVVQREQDKKSKKWKCKILSWEIL